MKNFISFYCFLFFLTILSCTEDNLQSPSKSSGDNKPIKLRVPDCNAGDNFVGIEYYLGKCKHHCDKGIGFRCGHTKYVCADGKLSSKETGSNCSTPYGEEFVPIDTLVSAELSNERVIGILIHFIDRYTARFTFLEPLPSGELAFDNELSIEIPMRWEADDPLTLGTQSFSYFEFVVGDYTVSTVGTPYGSALVDMNSY